MAFAVDLTGSVLDRRYRITGLLGRGGMGYVYDAVHVALDHRVAVKVLHPRYAYEQRFRERFLQEARAASRIRHRNVVEIKDFGETPDDSVYFVMEYLDGHDVGAELEQHGALPWPRTRGILMQAASALHAAHLENIIHRDIKPGNCFLTTGDSDEDGDRVKLLDFGIAKVGSDQHADAQGKGLTGTGEVFGTASYMAPEQARGEVLDARSDMYSLGIMAYEMLTGEVPFPGINAIHVITRHLNDAPEPLRTINPEVPPAVEALVLRMMAKDAKDRYPSMAVVEQALRAIPEDVAEQGKRKTRMWSAQGDMRALVQGKKTGVSKVPSPPVIGAAKTRPEARPGAKPGAGAVKKTVVSGARATGGVTKPGAMKWAPVSPPPAKPPSPPLPPAIPTAAASSTARAPVARAPVARPPAVPPLVAPASMVTEATSVAPIMPPVAASVPPVAAPPHVPMTTHSPVPDRGMEGTNPPPGGGVVGTNPPPPGRGMEGTNPPPPGRGMEGTNPPPGRVDTSPSGQMRWSSWQSTNAGTGPLERVVETGSELLPQSLVMGEDQGISLRIMLVIGVMVILVGAASVGVTVAFLSNKAEANEVQESAGPEAGDESAVRPQDAAREEQASAGEGGGEGESGSDEAASGGEVMEIEAVGGGAVEPEPEPELELEPEPDPVELVEEEVAQPTKVESHGPTVPAHKTEKCVGVRADAEVALGQRKWSDLAGLAAQSRCWPSAEKVARRSMHVRALLEGKRFAACVKAGERAKDAQTVKMVDICRSNVP